jgi:hypothetical protein
MLLNHVLEVEQLPGAAGHDSVITDVTGDALSIDRTRSIVGDLLDRASGCFVHMWVCFASWEPGEFERSRPGAFGWFSYETLCLSALIRHTLGFVSFRCDVVAYCSARFDCTPRPQDLVSTGKIAIFSVVPRTQRINSFFHSQKKQMNFN